MKDYKYEIDGLRAIAIIGVLLHHYKVPVFISGFIGVDIFFTISGFLIGGMVIEKFNNKNFIFKEFYNNRFRRIAPALFVMLAASSIAAFKLMSPHDLRYFGGGVIFSIISFANVWFYNRINYFNPDVQLEPLIHTWSLGVEEQFYFIFPLIILISIRYPVKKYAAIILLFFISTLSFIWMLHQSKSNPDAAFYLPLTRFWEFSIGVITYKYKEIIYFKLKLYSEFLSTISLIGLLISLCVFSSNTWPSAITLMPVLFTAILLIFGSDSYYKFNPLHSPPLVFVGKISYSLYLYHQPIIVFSDIIYDKPRDFYYWILIIPVTFFMAIISWKYIEQPFRSRVSNKAHNIVVLIILPVSLITFALTANFYKGFPGRLAPQMQKFLTYQESFSDTYKKCLNNRKDIDVINIENTCVHGASVPPTIAIWGDSHAAILAKPLGDKLFEKGVAIKELTMSSCAPINGLFLKDWKRGEACVKWNSDVLNYLLHNSVIKTVIINANWKTYLETSNILQPINGWDKSEQDLDYEFKISRMLKNQLELIKLTGKEVIIINPIPLPYNNPINAYARKFNTVPPDNFYISRDVFLTSTKNTRDILSKSMASIYIQSENILCQSFENNCAIIENNIPLYFDEAHLSLPGAQKLINYMLSKNFNGLYLAHPEKPM